MVGIPGCLQTVMEKFVLQPGDICLLRCVARQYVVDFLEIFYNQNAVVNTNHTDRTGKTAGRTNLGRVLGCNHVNPVLVSTEHGFQIVEGIFIFVIHFQQTVEAFQISGDLSITVNQTQIHRGSLACQTFDTGYQ